MKRNERFISYKDALREALLQEMERDRRVFVCGLGVPDNNAVFGTARGLKERFGPERVFDTPLSEDAMTGIGLGAAINGLKPVHHHIRVDFLLLAFNQLANMVSILRYGSGGKVTIPFVIRAIIGRGWGQGLQHSKSMQSVFAHIPGLKVIMPSTPHDAKGLLTAAIRDENPVICLEHRWLYDQEGNVPLKQFTVPLGKSKVLRRGNDVTVVATSWMNIEARHASEILKKRGVSVEIVDPRTIRRWGEATIIRSEKKTSHCIVADNDWLNCVFSAEVAARVSRECFGELKSPVERIGFAPTPCPMTRVLEDEFYPNAGDIVRAIEKALKLK